MVGNGNLIVMLCPKHALMPEVLEMLKTEHSDAIRSDGEMRFSHYPCKICELIDKIEKGETND